MSKKSLACAISDMKVFSKPKVYLEQYPVSGNFASEILWDYYMNYDFEESRVCDLGCGTGLLGIGALLCGAKHVTFVDVDQSALNILRDNLIYLKENYRIDFDPFERCDIICMNVKKFSGEFDVVFQNPPFGTKSKKIDSIFLEKAMSIAPLIYSIHKSATREYIRTKISSFNFVVEREFDYKFPIKNTMKGHKKATEFIETTCFKARKL